MTLNDIIELIREHLSGEKKAKTTGKIEFEINMAQGGIGECKVKTEEKLKVK